MVYFYQKYEPDSKPERTSAMVHSFTELEPFAVGFLNAPIGDREYRIACGMLSYAQHLPLHLKEHCTFACHVFPELGVNYTYGDGIKVTPALLEQEILQYPEYAEELRSIRDTFIPLDTRRMISESLTQTQRDLAAAKVCIPMGEWGGHANPDYNMLLQLGTNGLRDKNNAFRKQNPGKDLFYDALILALDALDILGARYRNLALEKAEISDPEARTRLLRIAEAFTNIPMNPPRNFFEACQMFWLAFCFNGIDSPGRFDQFMGPFYDNSDETDRLLCLEALWQLFQETRTWNLCISGSDENGKDMTNQLSYDILKTARKYKYETPNLTMRTHKNTPASLWDSAIETLATGIGMPALYNDEVVCPSLEDIGIPPVDSHNYCLNGCNQIDIFGKSHMGLEDGDISLAKCLELTLHNGYCPKQQKALGKSTGDPTKFGSYEDLWNAYREQLEYVVDLAVQGANQAQELYAIHAPNPWRSNLIQGCIETGRDYKARGPVYGHGQFLTEGLADAVNSLAVLKHFVFDTEKYTMEQVMDALNHDYQGYEQMQQEFLQFEKFGNDNEYVDQIAADVQKHYFGYLLTKETWRGGIYGGGCSPFDRAAVFGDVISAMPCGRNTASNLLADSIGPVPGTDHNGPTAMLKSVLHYDHRLAKSGLVMQMRFSKTQFNTPEGKEAFRALINTYFENGGQQLSVNVVSAEELHDAQTHPELYSDLMVRVGGFSARFTGLDKGLQDNIIARTEY